MNTAIIITAIVCFTVVLLAAIGTRPGKRPTVSLVPDKSDKNAAKCSGCGRSENLAAWNGCNYCPSCGAQIRRG